MSDLTALSIVSSSNVTQRTQLTCTVSSRQWWPTTYKYTYLYSRHWLSGLHSPWKYLLPAFHTCSPFKAGSASGDLYEKAYSYPRVSYPYCYSTYYNYCTQQKFTLRLMEHLLLEETCLLLCSSRFEIRDTEPSSLPVVGQTAVNRARHCCWICTQTESALRCAFCSTGTLQTTIHCARNCFRRIEKAWSRLHGETES